MNILDSSSKINFVEDVIIKNETILYYIKKKGVYTNELEKKVKKEINKK